MCECALFSSLGTTFVESPRRYRDPEVAASVQVVEERTHFVRGTLLDGGCLLLLLIDSLNDPFEELNEQTHSVMITLSLSLPIPPVF